MIAGTVTMVPTQVVVQQPINLTRFTHRLVREAHEYLQLRHDDNLPFVLFVPWLQTHTALHASELFRGRSAHGRYGDELEEMELDDLQAVFVAHGLAPAKGDGEEEREEDA